jgi:hypothetical protein
MILTIITWMLGILFGFLVGVFIRVIAEERRNSLSINQIVDEDRHPNIEEIIKVLKYLNENRVMKKMKITEALEIYEKEKERQENAYKN